jgi:hypothetical protein
MRWTGWTTLSLVASCAVLASSQVRQSLADRARASDRVVLVEVMATRVDLPPEGPRRMTTVTTLLVRERYKGDAPERLELVQLGGKSGLWESHVAGDATFVAGETAIVFLKCPEASRCTLVGLGRGKLPLRDRQVELDGVSHPLEWAVDEIRRGGRWVGRPIGRKP